jgi:hypothetical protein
MDFMSVRELSKSPKIAFERLSRQRKAVITRAGKPEAFLLHVDSDSFEQTYLLLQKLEFALAIENMQRQSVENGNYRMTLDEINAEIAAARQG